MGGWRSWLMSLIVATAAGCAPAADPAGEQASLAALLGGDADPGFPRARAPRIFRFPQDHGPHPEFRNEWWYVTGNLRTPAGRHFGYELTLFRFALSPQRETPSESAWASNQVFIGHLALTDVAGEAFYAAERFSRGAAGLAGATPPPVKVWLYDWTLRRGEGGNWRLAARDGAIGIDLSLDPLKPPVLQGDAGLSQKSAEPGNASYYYSLPRLATSGSIVIDQSEFEVNGLSWMDREWSTSALGDQQQGWDWFALHLGSGHDLMFYSLRRLDGSRDDFSAGSWIAPDGSVTRLSKDDVTLEVLDHWDSPAGGRYPAAWRLRVPSLDLDLEIEPVLAAQELTTWVRYWEGAVTVEGHRAGDALSGRGYVELTGYASSPDAAR